MDALKRAEESKRLASENPEAATSVPAAPPHLLVPNDEQPRRNPLPDLSLHSDAVDADLAAHSTPTPLPRRGVGTNPAPSPVVNAGERDRAAARNVFAAKTPANAPSGIALFIGFSVLAALLIGAYFWWQLRSVSGGSLSSRVPTPEPVATKPAPPASSIKKDPPVVAARPEINAPRSEEKPSEPLRAFRPAPEPRISTEAVPAPRKAAAETLPPVDTPVRLSRSQPKPNQTLEQAYEALQTGRLDEARRGYEIVLRSDAKNIDALLGMATLAARQGQNDWAQTYYQRALESDPNDPTAQAGLINLHGASNVGASESQLKTALSSQPESAALHFALGNLYARQERWNEAQQAYFQAYSKEPANADFIFNLAVSLDHLHQSKLAAQYYQMALNVTDSTSASFDRKLAQTRLLDLQP